MLVIGIDPSTTSFGYAVYDHATDHLVASGVLRANGRDTFDRIERLRHALQLVLQEHKAVQFMLVERMFSTKGHADRALANIVFAVKMAASNAGMRVREIAVSKWRKRLVGKGNATKDEVRAYLQMVHRRTIHCLDESDAIGIAMAAEAEDFR